MLNSEESSRYLNAREVGAMLGISIKSVYRLVKRDPTLPATFVSAGVIRFHPDRLRRWLETRTQGRPLGRPVLSSAKSVPPQEARGA